MEVFRPDRPETDPPVEVKPGEEYVEVLKSDPATLSRALTDTSVLVDALIRI